MTTATKTFEYSVRDRRGKLVGGKLEAPSEAALVQKLVGMGDALYEALLAERKVTVRMYAPVGSARTARSVPTVRTCPRPAGARKRSPLSLRSRTVQLSGARAALGIAGPFQCGGRKTVFGATRATVGAPRCRVSICLGGLITSSV